MIHPRLVHFDWAMKRLLRNKSNAAVLEGFLSVLLNDDIHIEEFLDSESNQESSNDKYNRVDMLAKNNKGELVIIEVQNNHEYDYFHRMLYGASKAITDFIKIGQRYENVKKVYSINIVYFELGQGADYIYRGKTEFRGLNVDEELLLSPGQREHFIYYTKAGDLFPEYYVLRVNEFDKLAASPLDEWMEFLKTGDISDNATAQGLPEARKTLRMDALSEKDKRDYVAFKKSEVDTESFLETALMEGRREGREEGIQEGLQKGRMEIAIKMKSKGTPTEIIEEITGLSKQEIDGIV